MSAHAVVMMAELVKQYVQQLERAGAGLGVVNLDPSASLGHLHPEPLIDFTVIAVVGVGYQLP